MSAVPDRRAVRRQATVEEILAAALGLMERDGVAGMSLSAVARAVGMKPPSLYEYFPSKNALYDALFEQGATSLRTAVRVAANHPAHASDPIESLTAGTSAYVRWSLENRVTAQLLMWRPVPGFEPSENAYAPSLGLVADLATLLGAAVETGRLAPAAASSDALLLLTCVISGVVSQQMANEPLAGTQSGRYARLLEPAVNMWLRYYAS
ncbi:TetR/AcrR family transcriptional regulator [Arthrobacter sp. GMC3]|uniref:TetR/AcrR family transcriptional regulator n=1 Tax=Arthrobacter sp. GMC3 TaxID=2058894 RepID=UPI000CE54730|nr:TetR/AcrR family transcriptional regulator [Arthrobacter sp. GMC3]